MPRENAAAKAARYLVAGRVVVTAVSPGRARAVVRGDGRLYRVTVNGPDWTCTCPARGRCSHQLAVGLVIATDIEQENP